MPVFSDASLPESSRMSSGFSVSCLHSSMVSLRKSGVSFWQCCFPIRSSRLTRYPLRRVDFFNKTAFSKYLPYEYQTTGSNEPLIAEFNVYFLHCTASACLLILSLYRIMHDDTVKKQNFV